MAVKWNIADHKLAGSETMGLMVRDECDWKTILQRVEDEMTGYDKNFCEDMQRSKGTVCGKWRKTDGRY